MTYEVARTQLLAKAGRNLAEKLLPKAFKLWHSDHSTGIQMTIVTAASPGLPVWKGSIWHSSIYEFNDRGDIPGLQPGFEFARKAIDDYFMAVESAVGDREVRRREATSSAEIEASRKRDAAIEATRASLTTS